MAQTATINATNPKVANVRENFLLRLTHLHTGTFKNKPHQLPLARRAAEALVHLTSAFLNLLLSRYFGLQLP